MPRYTTPTEATIIDYLHRAGDGVGGRQAIIDYMTLVAGYAEGHVSRALHTLAHDGLLERNWDGGSSPATYSIDYDAMCEDDGLC
jgi:hypothetical protein